MKKKSNSGISINKLKTSILHVVGDFHQYGGIQIKNIEKELVRYLPNQYNPNKYYVPGKYNVKQFGCVSMKEFLVKMYDDVYIKNFNKSYATAFLTFKHIYCNIEEVQKICRDSYCKFKHTNEKSYAYNKQINEKKGQKKQKLPKISKPKKWFNHSKPTETKTFKQNCKQSVCCQYGLSCKLVHTEQEKKYFKFLDFKQLQMEIEIEIEDKKDNKKKNDQKDLKPQSFNKKGKRPLSILLQFWRKLTQKRAYYDWDKHRFPFKFMCDELINGIMVEGKLIGEESSAKQLCETIKSLKNEDWNGLCACVIKLYTAQTFIYRQMNKALRDEDMTKIKTLGPFCQLLNKAIQNENYHIGANVKGYVGTVWRGATLSQEMIKEYKVGLEFQWDGFTSTSQSKLLALIWGNVLFRIDLPERDWIFKYYGIDISKISKFPSELEVLLYPGTQYGVFGIYMEGKKKVIHLKVLDFNKKNNTAKNKQFQSKLLKKKENNMNVVEVKIITKDDKFEKRKSKLIKYFGINDYVAERILEEKPEYLTYMIQQNFL